MDFISNLIKRPISLVLNETPTTMDKYPISVSLPNTPSELENKKDLPTPTNEQQNNNNNKRPLSMSSSYNSDNMTDFIGVPEDFLDEFKDILPPPPLPLENSNTLTQSILDMDNTDSLSITPPPPPLFLYAEKENSLTPLMKAQTIDDFLLQINDNLQQAGLNDDVLAIATPSNKLELSSLSSKAALNNTKLLASSCSASNIQMHTSKTSATAAGSANSTVIENDSLQRTFRDDAVLENVIMCDGHKQHEPDQHATKDKLNNFVVNKTSNTFMGLTEFDEAKIPELPDDLNPNIEEQYKATFEECFIPNLNTEQNSTFRNEFNVDKTHFLLPTEADAISSDNETFADCNDEKDPLTTTFAEPASLDATTDMESYQSAANKSSFSSFNNTMENIADITMEAEKYPLKRHNQPEVFEKSQIEPKQETHFEPMDEEEPMDVDMNSTMEMIHNTSNNIQHVEKVLQHAENILQQLEDKKSLEEVNTENPTDLLEKQTEFSKMCTPPENVANKDIDIERSRHEIYLNKSIELPVNNVKTLSSECIIENLKYVTQEQMNQIEKLSDNLNSTNDAVNSSTISNSSVKSAVDNKAEEKLNVTLSLSASIISQKSSSPSSPNFPSKTAEITGFPRSPKAIADKPINSPFLEKSDYLEKLETEEKHCLNNLIEESSNLNGAWVETASVLEENRDIFRAENPEEQGFKTLSTDTLGEYKTAEEKRRTFSVISNENSATPLKKFPSTEKTDNRRTFAVTDVDNGRNETVLVAAESDSHSRRTFNLPVEEFSPKATEQTNMNTSFEPMEVDGNIPQSPTSSATDAAQMPQSASLSVMKLKSEYQPIPVMQQTCSMPLIQQKEQCQPIPNMPPMQNDSQTYLPMSQSTASSTLKQPSDSPKSQSPSLPTAQDKSQSPPLSPTLQKSQSPPIATRPSHSQSPPLPAMQTQISPQPLPDSTSHQNISIKKEQISPPLFESTNISFASKPLSSLIQKRPSIRDARARAADILSAKEQSSIKVKDEKDIFVEKFTPSPSEDIFTTVTATSTTLTNSSGLSEYDQTTSSSSSSIINTVGQQSHSQDFEDEFNGNNNIILNPSDFDYLLTKGNNNTPVDRSSLLLKFDPLLGVPVPVNQGQQPTNTNNPCLSPTLEEEEEHNDSNRSFSVDTKTKESAKLLKERPQEVKLEQQVQQNKRQITQGTNKKNATMSVDVIKDMSLDNDCNKAFENSNSAQSDDKQINYKMDELEKKIKNEVLKTEDIEKKLKDAEQREEALIKRITEKDKTIAKMTGVIEAYEKAIAELIADKEQLTQHYEKQLAEVKADRDSNYHHLTSLETTFSDLHVKYEKSKEMTCQLKESEEALQAEKRKNLENLHLQEQRYDKMKNHAMQQLEIANKKLESLTREHSIELTKLKALLKKEEIARSSVNEQLAHKTKENAELVKICDELISGQGSNFSFEPFDPKKH